MVATVPSGERPQECASAERIILVEHNATHARLIQSALSASYEVEWVAAGAEALRCLRRGRCLAVITEHELPDMSGFELRRRIMGSEPAAPVIMTCAEDDPPEIQAGLQGSGCDFFVKGPAFTPFVGQVVRQVLRRCELERKNRLLCEVVDHTSDCVITTDLRGAILGANAAVEPTFGYDPALLREEQIGFLFPGELRGNRIREVISDTVEERSWDGLLTGRRSDETVFPVSVHTSVLRDCRGEPARLVFVARDISERRDMLEKLRRLSVTDELTGLFNYRFLRDRLRYEFRRAGRYGQPLSFIMIDLDFFKSVNDTYGHPAGDKVLHEVARMIREKTRHVDVVARYGGEEFAILLPNTGRKGARQCARILWRAIGRARVAIRAGVIRVTASLGVSTLEEGTETEDELLRQADTALLMAKRRGRNNVCAWHQIQNEMQRQVKEEADSLSDLRARLRQLNRRMKAGAMESARSLLRAVARRAPHVALHSSRVSTIATDLAIRAGLDGSLVEAVRYAGMLHDLGSIAVHPDIWDKSGPLTPEEMASVREHPIVGESIAAELTFLEAELPVIRHHHEHFDGNGYPEGLAGEAIPLGARVLAIADAYDAMLSERPFRGPMSRQAALSELKRCAGKQFDPALVDVFVSMSGEEIAVETEARSP